MPMKPLTNTVLLKVDFFL